MSSLDPILGSCRSSPSPTFFMMILSTVSVCLAVIVFKMCCRLYSSRFGLWRFTSPSRDLEQLGTAESGLALTLEHKAEMHESHKGGCGDGTHDRAQTRQLLSQLHISNETCRIC